MTARNRLSAEYFVASDVSALVRHTKQVVYLEENEIVSMTPEDYKIAKLSGENVTRPTFTVHGPQP